MEEVTVKIEGYRQLSQEEQEAINRIKLLEVAMAAQITEALSLGAEPRDVALARTSFQEGMFWMVRSIAKPASPLNDVMQRAASPTRKE